MKKCLCIILLACLVAGFSYADWEMYYGGIQNDIGYSVLQTSDGGFIVVGSSNSYSPGDHDVYIVKTDGSGGIEWMRDYGEGGNDYASSVLETPEGDFLIVGYTYSSTAGNTDLYLLKVDPDGDTLWTRKYGGAGYDGGNYIFHASDGYYLSIGHTTSRGAGEYDIWILKFDSDGDTLWTRTYGDTAYDVGECAVETPEGDFAVTGYATAPTGGSRDLYIMKIDDAGEFIWGKSYGGDGEEIGYSISQTTDGGYVIGGRTGSFGPAGLNLFLVKTDAVGDTQWVKGFGGDDSDFGVKVCPTWDGGYLLSGYTMSYGAGSTDGYLVRTDENGDTLWTRLFGDTGIDKFFWMEPTSDGGFIITGCIGTAGTDFYDLYLVKLDAEDAIEWITPLPSRFSMIAYPNPFNSTCSFKGIRGAWIEIFGLDGKLVHQGEFASEQYKWTPENGVNSGIYLTRTRIGSKTFMNKIIYLK
ncbi:T9SS type A sorting domain-containing protein [bacterium]|nr:T9SS type A sorting domain-containing protein [bacterium]